VSRRSIAALSAAWHVGLDVGDLASANSRGVRESSLQSKKIGVLIEHPVKFLPKNYRFFAAFFFEPMAAFFAIVFSTGCATQPRTPARVVTTGGLSHPPSYQM
jgi:hypothetical protein